MENKYRIHKYTEVRYTTEDIVETELYQIQELVKSYIYLGKMVWRPFQVRTNYGSDSVWEVVEFKENERAKMYLAKLNRLKK